MNTIDPTPDQILMKKIRIDMKDAISAAIAETPFSESFIAALVANESGGNPAVTRFEPKVFVDLAFVLAGIKPAYGSIGTEDLKDSIPGTVAPSFLRIRDLATSWGPTQIMGYHSVSGNYPLSELSQIDTHFPRCVSILRDFLKEWHLDRKTANPAFRFEESLFKCWNTGRPDGVTADPNYAARGLGRMLIYEALAQ